MFDLETLAQNFSAPLQSFCGISQIIGGSGNPPEQLITPRIMWSIKEPYIPVSGMPVTSWRKVTGTIDPEHFPLAGRDQGLRSRQGHRGQFGVRDRWNINS